MTENTNDLEMTKVEIEELMEGLKSKINKAIGPNNSSRPIAVLVESDFLVEVIEVLTGTLSKPRDESEKWLIKIPGHISEQDAVIAIKDGEYSISASDDRSAVNKALCPDFIPDFELKTLTAVNRDLNIPKKYLVMNGGVLDRDVFFKLDEERYIHYHTRASSLDTKVYTKASIRDKVLEKVTGLNTLDYELTYAKSGNDVMIIATSIANPELFPMVAGKMHVDNFEAFIA